MKHSNVSLITCHDGIFTENIEEHWDICINKFFEREEFIREMLDRSFSHNEIVDEGIYFKKKDKVAETLKSLLAVQDRIMLKHHIEVLKDGGFARLFPEYETNRSIIEINI